MLSVERNDGKVRMRGFVSGREERAMGRDARARRGKADRVAAMTADRARGATILRRVGWKVLRRVAVGGTGCYSATL